MISRIKLWWKYRELDSYVKERTRVTGFNILENHNVLNPVNQEDLRAINDVKSFNKSFDAQQQQMQARAMVAHEPDCDVISCSKNSCFIWAPDKIVRKSTIKMKRNKPKGD